MVRIEPYPPFYQSDGQPLPIEKWPVIGKRGTRLGRKIGKWYLRQSGKKSLPSVENIPIL